eukprot:TRINITY_DN120719_c0_g1_i1.p1 TRINITY_DN120719_c0_g1~~TRINITY_DN120719_c0_g1_i1.p1  ORF type:complete len:485 (-),score=36.96 TRINITY_DN120719_c0_g1_i1:48-1442(-)
MKCDMREPFKFLPLVAFSGFGARRLSASVSASHGNALTFASPQRWTRTVVPTGRPGTSVRKVSQLQRRCKSDAGSPDSFDVAIVGGGIAGLAAMRALIRTDRRVLLVEQGRGLGGRACTRRAKCSESDKDLSFDHGCQYFSVKADKQPSFAQAVAEWQQDGVVQTWAARVGSISYATEQRGMLDMTCFASYPAEKLATLFVGTPRMSALGKHILTKAQEDASRSGSQGSVDVRTATRAEHVQWCEDSATWQLQLKSKGSEGASAAAKARVLAVATSAKSVGRILGTSTPEEVDDIKSPVCWALMVAVSEPLTHIAFDGAFVTNFSEGVLAWVSRDTSKPGRVNGADGSPGSGASCPECWVLHASPDWSFARAGDAKEDVRQALLEEFERNFLAGAEASRVVYSEAFRWNNAYPLNPLRRESRCIVQADRNLAIGGDWAAGDRLGDAFESGAALATCAGNLLSDI